MANAYAASTEVTTWSNGDDHRDDERVEQVPAEMARRPGVAEHVEREAGRAGAGSSSTSSPGFSAAITVV